LSLFIFILANGSSVEVYRHRKERVSLTMFYKTTGSKQVEEKKSESSPSTDQSLYYSSLERALVK
jgi:hypothetical protein